MPETALPGFNTVDGDHALFSNTTGIGNSAFGWYSLFANSDGAFNTGVGAGTLALNVGNQSTGEGTQNTAVGAVALLLNSKGQGNTAVGASALLSNDSTGNGFANFNSAFGAGALENNTDGDDNTAVGNSALFSNTIGGLNTAVGDSALFSNTIGFENTAVGTGALSFNTTGGENVAIGRSAGSNIVTASGVIAIGAFVPAADVSGTTWIANIFGVTTISGTTAPVIVSQDGQLGTISSSARFKKDIADMGKSSEAILSLRPVTFHYKSDANAVAQFGLIAEEVEKVDPDLIIRDKEGKPYSVRYEAVNAMLLNEFLKEHKKVEQQAQQMQEQQIRIERQQATIAELKATATTQQATIAELQTAVAEERKSFQLRLAEQQKQIEALTSGLQRVSTQVELAPNAFGAGPGRPQRVAVR